LSFASPALEFSQKHEL